MKADPDSPSAEQLALVRRQLQMQPTATDAEVIGALVNLVAHQYDVIEQLRAALQQFGPVSYYVH